MSKLRATVSKIINFSCVDGPGNRMVIFLQGCNFKCLNCHNPHTIGFCDSCGDCVDACPKQALVLSSEQKITWDLNACIGCDACIDHCDKSASPRTSEYRVADLIKMIKANVAFINGVTVSGGEATLQAKFITALFEQIKTLPELQHLSCFVDSNGSLSENGWEKLLSVTDGVMLDLKAWSQDTHTWLTGHSSYKVLRSIKLLADQGKLYELRLLHIPGKTDFELNIEELSSFLNQLPNSVRIKLNAFRHHGTTGVAREWANCSESQLKTLAHQLELSGVNNLILPSVY